MGEIVQDINSAILLNATDQEQEQLKLLLTKEDPAAYHSPLWRKRLWDGKRKLYTKTKYGVMFKSGLVPYVQAELPGHTLKVVDKLIQVKGIDLSKFRDYQKEAILQIFEKRVGIVDVPTAGGKTYIALGLFQGFIAKKYLYVVHREELFTEKYEFFVNYFGDEVGRMGSGFKESGKKYVVGMIQTLYSMVKNKDLEFFKEVQVLIVDEGHKAGSPSYRDVIEVCQDLRVKIGLTGSVPDLDTISGMYLLGALGQVIVKISPEELIKEGYVVPPMVTMYEGEWNVELKELWKQYNFAKQGQDKEYWEEVRRRGLTECKDRNEIIAALVKGKSGVLIIVDRIKQGEILSRMIGAPFTWSGSEHRAELFDKFKKEEIKILISSPILQEGIDIHGIRVVVLAGGGKAEIALLQRVGRGMRLQEGKKYLEVIDFWDKYPPKLLDHSKQRMKTYQKVKYAVKIENVYDKLIELADKIVK